MGSSPQMDEADRWVRTQQLRWAGGVTVHLVLQVGFFVLLATSEYRPWHLPAAVAMVVLGAAVVLATCTVAWPSRLYARWDRKYGGGQ